MDYYDYSTFAVGMTYSSSEEPGGVTLDGAADAVGTALADWELVTGIPGSVLVTGSVETTIDLPGGELSGLADGFYRDEFNSQSNSGVQQCWGDAHFIGASGFSIDSGLANTDPRSSPFETFRGTRVVQFAQPGVTNEQAATWAGQVAQPVATTVTPYAP
jgi:hypothetical protein